MKSREAIILAVVNAILAMVWGSLKKFRTFKVASHRHREVTVSNPVQVLNFSGFPALLLGLRS